MIRQFPAKPGSLGAPKRQARVGPDHAINEAAARLDLPCKPFGFFRVTAPDA